MSKELFNYVWLINPNPSFPLTIYLFNQVPCTLHAAVCGWWWRGSKRTRESNKGGCKTIHLEEAYRSQRTGFFVLLAILQMHEFLLTSCCEHSKVRELSPWEMSTRRPGEVVLAYHTGMLVFSSFLGKGNLKALSPAWKRGCQED